MPLSTPVTRRRLVAGGAVALSIPARVRAAEPAQFRILVGFPPGGGTDAIARVLADRLRELAARPVLVENRPGAGGRLALEAVKQAGPASGVLAFTPDFPVTIYPALYPRLGYDPARDFTPLGGCTESTIAFVVGPQVPASVTDVASYVRWAKERPANRLYGATPGSPLHFAGFMLGRAAGVPLEVVTYKGGAQILQDVMGDSWQPSSIRSPRSCRCSAPAACGPSARRGRPGPPRCRRWRASLNVGIRA